MRHLNTEYIVQNMNKKYRGYGYSYHAVTDGEFDVIISTKTLEVTIIHDVKSKKRILAIDIATGEIHGINKKQILESPSGVNMCEMILWINPDGENLLHENKPMIETLVYVHLMNKKYPKSSFHVSSMEEQDFDVVFAEHDKKFSEYHCAVDRSTKELYSLGVKGNLLENSMRVIGSEASIREHVKDSDITGNFLYLPYLRKGSGAVLKMLPMMK